MNYLLPLLELMLTLFGVWVASWIAGRLVDVLCSGFFPELIPRQSLLGRVTEWWSDHFSRPDPRGFDVVIHDERNVGKVIMKVRSIQTPADKPVILEERARE